MMYLGNSRILQGRSSNNVVYGEWKAVAPNGASGGYYGAVGNIVDSAVNVFAMEWSELTGTLIFGGQFPNIVNGNPTLQYARSIGYFNGTDYKVLPPETPGIGTTGVGNVIGTGYVYDIREIKHSTNHYNFLIAGLFNSDGLTAVPSNETISIAQYSTEEEKWIPFGSGEFTGRIGNNDAPVFRISNLISDSSGITAYMTGEFSDIKYNSNSNQFSQDAVCYRYNTPAPVGGHTSQLVACGGSFDVTNYAGSAWGGLHFRNGSNGDNKLYLISDGHKMVVFSNPESPSTATHDITIDLPEIDDLIRPRIRPFGIESGFGMLSFAETSTDTENYLYSGYVPIQQSVLSNTSTNITFNSIDPQLNGPDIGTVFYNSGNHLVAVLDGLDGPKKILFYNTNTNKFKDIPLPDLTTIANPKISCVEIDDSGNIYIGGVFQFQDSDGNTACSIAKFVPNASKLP